MKGYMYSEPSGGTPLPDGLPMWEAIVVEAVGTVIEFWGFKSNHGRVWALLYLRDGAFRASDLQRELSLSKGAVSMILRELETWGVVRRVRVPQSKAWHFKAETAFMKMIRHVFEQREVQMVKRVRQDLEDALRLAKGQDEVSEQTVARLSKMCRLAGVIDHALDMFLRTSKLDIASSRGIFGDDER